VSLYVLDLMGVAVALRIPAIAWRRQLPVITPRDGDK
jgi:hypothetical protein